MQKLHKLIDLLKSQLSNYGLVTANGKDYEKS